MENRLQRDKKKSTEPRPLQKFEPATEVPRCLQGCRGGGDEKRSGSGHTLKAESS